MQFSEILSSLPTFSAVELFELETVVTRLLIDSGFEKTLRPALRVGHIVEYFHSGYREVSEGVIRYLAEDTVTLYDYEAGSDVTVPYFAVVVPDPLQTPQTSIPPRPPVNGFQ